MASIENQAKTGSSSLLKVSDMFSKSRTLQGQGILRHRPGSLAPESREIFLSALFRAMLSFTTTYVRTYVGETATLSHKGCDHLLPSLAALKITGNLEREQGLYLYYVLLNVRTYVQGGTQALHSSIPARDSRSMQFLAKTCSGHYVRRP